MNEKENENPENNIFKTQKLESLFSSNSKQNNESWFTRDGRNKNSLSYIEEEQLFKEHISKLQIQKPNIKELENIEFKVSYLSSSSLQNKEISLKKSEPKEFKNFNGIPFQLWQNICNLQFKYLTPIQKEVIPFMQNGKDIVACAETGSGKTIAYLFPLIGNMLVKGTPKNPFLNENDNNNNLYHNKILCYPLSLILVPTRELALQINNESKKMSFKTGIRTVCVYGGVDKKKQILELKKGCDILIGTPGRLIDLLGKNLISLKMISSLILDEADRMLDMGFKPQLDKIINDFMPDKLNRQNLLFSATFAKDVQEIAKSYLKDFYYIQPKIQSPKQIEHKFINVSKYNKNDILENILKKNLGKYLIFVSTKSGVDKLGEILNDLKFNISCIHGDKKQDERKCAIDNFTNGKTLILIATDVVGRGLDFTKVDVVINYDMTTNIEDYIHRIGRTGRIGQKGKAITFIDGSEKMIFNKLIKYLESQSQIVPDWLRELGNCGKKNNCNIFFDNNKNNDNDNNKNNDNNNNIDNDNYNWNINQYNSWNIEDKDYSWKIENKDNSWNNDCNNNNDKNRNVNCDDWENNNQIWNNSLNHKRKRSNNN